MEPRNHIISSCLIDSLSVYKDSQLFFENHGADPLSFLEDIYLYLGMNYPRFYKMDNLSKLGLLAAEVLLRGAIPGDVEPQAVGAVLSNANASLDTDIKYFASSKEIPSPALFVYTLPNIVIGEICIRHGYKGENAFFVSSRFDPAFLVQYVDNLLNNDILQYCLCGWVDLLRDQYQAALFLIGRSANKPFEHLLFEKENIEKIYRLNNG